MSEAVTIVVGESGDEIVQLDGARVKDLERATLTAAIDLRAVRLIIWAFYIEPDGREFSSPECRALWKLLISFSPGHHLVPTREEVRRAFPTFRFVKASFPLLQMAGKVFKKPRTLRLAPTQHECFDDVRSRRRLG